MKLLRRKNKKNEDKILKEDQIDEITSEISSDIEEQLKEEASEIQSFKNGLKNQLEGGEEQQIREAKIEYQAVTQYLTDIQKIEDMDKDRRMEVDETARNIIMLTRERSRYQASDIRLSDVAFRQIAKFEKEMDKELNRMQDNEKYDRKAKSDMRKLDACLKALEQEKGELATNHKSLKKLGMISLVLVSVMALVLLYLSYNEIADMKMIFAGFCFLAACLAFYLFYQSRKNNYEAQMNQKKINKAVSLQNMVKIKFVNNKNALDYQYTKLMVSGADELAKIWQSYKKAQAEAKQYKSNTSMLDFYNQLLVEHLKQIKVSDCDVWIYQAAALIDKREMVEIRHRLNTRRQKLREQIEFLNQNK